MNDFIAAQDRALLEQHGLASFDALWALQLEAVDEPNTERGGWSSVYRLELGDRAYYLKRQSNHLTRSLWHPLGEPTFAREFRNIRRYAELGIPALQAAFFAERLFFAAFFFVAMSIPFSVGPNGGSPRDSLPCPSVRIRIERDTWWPCCPESRDYFKPHRAHQLGEGIIAALIRTELTI